MRISIASTYISVPGQIAAGVIYNTHVNAAAAITYSKLNLTDSIRNADIFTAAAITYDKLLSGAINTHLIPDLVVPRDLGSPITPWRTLYADSIQGKAADEFNAYILLWGAR